MADVLNPNAAHRQTTDRATSPDTIPQDELHQKISTDHINRQNENPLMGQLLPLPSRDIPPRKHLQPLDTLCVRCMPLLVISSLAKDLLDFPCDTAIGLPCTHCASRNIRPGAFCATLPPSRYPDLNHSLGVAIKKRREYIDAHRRQKEGEEIPDMYTCKMDAFSASQDFVEMWKGMGEPGGAYEHLQPLDVEFDARKDLLNAPPYSNPRRQLDENHDPKPARTMDEHAASSPIIIPQDVIDRNIPIYGLRDFSTQSRCVAKTMPGRPFELDAPTCVYVPADALSVPSSKTTEYREQILSAKYADRQREY